MPADSRKERTGRRRSWFLYYMYVLEPKLVGVASRPGLDFRFGLFHDLRRDYPWVQAAPHAAVLLQRSKSTRHQSRT